MKGGLLCVLLLLAALSAATRQSATRAIPSDEEIRQILVDRIDRDHQAVGIVVGVVERTGRRVVSYGRLDADDARPLNGDTVFEIGSITKVFTSLLLADMVQRKEVALNDPIARYLPAGTKVPERGGRQITLVDLATHTSGLPRLPANLQPKDRANPYADYTVDQLYAFLSSYALPRDIGVTYEYSNLGGGLLGHILTRRAGMEYEALVRARIAGPLAMTSTSVVLSEDSHARLAVGHDDKLAVAANWDLPTLAGAGALRSTANDLLTFLSASLGLTKSGLTPAMTAMFASRRSTGAPNLDVALGWHIVTRSDRDLIWHNGGTGGYRSFMGYDAAAGVGVVVLSNTSTAAGVDDIGRHILDPRLPLLQAPKTHVRVAVEATLFDRYVGRYALAANLVLTITRENERLFAQGTNQPRIELFAEGVKDYFMKAVDAQITFEVDAHGVATGLTLHQNGQSISAKRIE